MEDPKVGKLREKLGISAKDQQETAGQAISPNLRKKISTDPKPGGNFLSATTDPKSGGNFLSALGS